MFSFIKYNGLGNDFVIIDNRDGAISFTDEDIVRICHRFFGIGADGLMLAEKSSKADIRMVFYNSDGSRAGMCGNGLRCFTRFAYEKLDIHKAEIAVETDSGILTAGIVAKDCTVAAVKVNMGRPIFESGSIPCTIAESPVLNKSITIGGKQYNISSMLMGVPHTVIFTDDISDETVVAEGKLIENSEFFPRKTNVNFVKVLKDNEIVLRTWERGAGYTYACGTGACASVVAGILSGKLQDSVLVHLRGGDLQISWRDMGDVFMEGPAVEVFEGKYTLK
jgi:diaminopimelate epimerase